MTESGDPRRGRRTQAQRRAESEERLLRAFAELVVEKGVGQTSLNDIGRRAGSSHTLVLHLFGSRAALLARLTESVDDGTPVSLMGDPVDVVAYWVQVFGDYDDGRLLEDPRFATPEARAQHREDLLNEVKALIKQIPDAAALNTALADHPLLGTRVRSLADLAESPWANAIGLVAEAAPGVPVPNAPWTADSAVIGVHGPAADRGAHNVEVLSEIAGLDKYAIDMLAKDRVIGGTE
jgi:AcrR family transcriptional regulator